MIVTSQTPTLGHFEIIQTRDAANFASNHTKAHEGKHRKLVQRMACLQLDGCIAKHFAAQNSKLFASFERFSNWSAHKPCWESCKSEAKESEGMPSHMAKTTLN